MWVWHWNQFSPYTYNTTAPASLSDILPLRKDVVNKCLEFAVYTVFRSALPPPPPTYKCLEFAVYTVFRSAPPPPPNLQVLGVCCIHSFPLCTPPPPTYKCLEFAVYTVFRSALPQPPLFFPFFFFSFFFLGHRSGGHVSELRSCVKVEVAVLGSPSLIVLNTVQHLIVQFLHLVFTRMPGELP